MMEKLWKVPRVWRRWTDRQAVSMAPSEFIDAQRESRLEDLKTVAGQFTWTCHRTEVETTICKSDRDQLDPLFYKSCLCEKSNLCSILSSKCIGLCWIGLEYCDHGQNIFIHNRLFKSKGTESHVIQILQLFHSIMSACVWSQFWEWQYVDELSEYAWVLLWHPGRISGLHQHPMRAAAPPLPIPRQWLPRAPRGTT